MTAGDGALVGTIILLLDLRLRDPEASDALEGLPWVQEGIVEYMAYTASVDPEPLRQEAADVFDLLLLLEQGPSGRELFLTAVAKTWLQNGMADHEREVVSALLSRSNMQWERAERIVRGQSLDAIATLPWTQRENELYESSDIRGLRGLIQLGGLEDDRVFWAVLDRPWVQDGLTSDEANLIEGSLRLLWRRVVPAYSSGKSRETATTTLVCTSSHFTWSGTTPRPQPRLQPCRGSRMALT